LFSSSSQQQFPHYLQSILVDEYNLIFICNDRKQPSFIKFNKNKIKKLIPSKEIKEKQILKPPLTMHLILKPRQD
jgi:hypothetical protein